jgi:hypothetical protein
MGTHRSEEHKQNISLAGKGKLKSEEHKQNISLGKKNKHTGKDSPNFGKRLPYAGGRGKRSICEAGYEVLSSYERKFSDGLYSRGIKHNYEPQRFYFGNYSYLPDYYIPELDLWIEIKGYITSKNIIQHRMFIKTGHNLIVLGGEFFKRDKSFERVLQKLEEDVSFGKRG